MSSDKGRSQNLELLRMYEAMDYGITRAFSTGEDIPYEAAMSAVKAAAAQIAKSVSEDEEADEDEDSLDLWPPYPPYHPVLAFPVVVTDGLLFRCCFDQGSQVALTQIDNAALAWEYPTEGDFIHPEVVYIYTASALGKLVEHASALAKALSEYLPSWVRIGFDRAIARHSSAPSVDEAMPDETEEEEAGDSIPRRVERKRRPANWPRGG